MSLTDTAKEIFSLTANVENLMGQYDRLEARVLELEKAVSRLEGKEELLVEKAKNAA